MGGIGGNRGRDHPQRGQQPRTIPQSALRLPAPFTQGSLALRGKGGWDGDADCRNQRPKFWSKIWLAVATPQARRPVGPPRNDNGFLSFRGQCAHWTWESVLFTMDGGSGRRGRRPLRKAQSTTQASRRAAKRPRPRPRGMGGNRRKDHPKRGTAPRPPGQRLAKRKARKEQLVKFGLCPMTSECSTAYHVRKSEQNPARAPADITSTEQDRLGPRPAARQGASRARNCAATSVFSFDGSTAVFFLPPQKENGGGLLQVITCRHAPFGAAAPRHAGVVVPYGRQLPFHKGSLGWGKKPRRPLSRSPRSVQLT